MAAGAASSSRAATMSVSSGGVTAPCVPPPSAPSTNPNSRNSCVAYCGRRGARPGLGIARRRRATGGAAGGRRRGRDPTHSTFSTSLSTPLSPPLSTHR